MQPLQLLQENIKLPEGCSQEQYVAEITRQVSRLHDEQQRIMTEQLNQVRAGDQQGSVKVLCMYASGSSVPHPLIHQGMLDVE
jgi:hypothetical protein